MFFIQVVRSRPGGRIQLSGGSSKMASAFSSIRARCPQKVRRRDLTMYESGGWLEMQQMWAFLTKSCQRMSRILRRHHWSTASIRCISALFSYPAFRSTEYGSTKSCTDRFGLVRYPWPPPVSIKTLPCSSSAWNLEVCTAVSSIAFPHSHPLKYTL